MKRRTLLQSIAAAPIVSAPFVHTAHAQAITLHGAVQFNDDHAFNRALLKFEELVKKYNLQPNQFSVDGVGWEKPIEEGNNALNRRVEIKEGVKPGDVIVNAGQNRLTNGAAVTIDNSVEPSQVKENPLGSGPQ